MTKEELVDSIHERVSNVLDDVSRDDIEERVEKMSDFRLPDDELERSVVGDIAEEHDMERGDFTQSSSNELATVTDVKDMDEEEWVSLRVAFDDEWDPAHEAMVQQGLLGDSTGRIKFTAWDWANPPELEEGKSYEIKNVVTEEYQGNTNIKFTNNTTVSELDEEIEANAGGSSVEVDGALVSVQAGSGLIKRCPEEDCTRVLKNGSCSDHGDVDGEFDLRIKGVLDNGVDTYEVIFNREKTEELTGMSLDEAKEIAMDKLDTEAVMKEMHDDIVCRYYHVEGPKAGRYVLVDEFEQGVESSDVDELLSRAQGDN